MTACAACHTELPEGAVECDHCGQPVDDPLVGQVLGGRYKLLGPLGRGGMGAVYRAEHVLMKKDVAVKVLHAELGQKPEIARRFEREAQSASRLDHPHIISVTDFGSTDDGTLFLVMELLHGRSLVEEIEKGPMAPERAVKIMLQVLSALEHAHAQGVVHRDLKPDNVYLVERDGVETAKLLDFGIARVEAAAEAEKGGAAGATALTQAGMVFGTPEYLSPEQALGEVADGRADLYAAGVMLHEMIAGERPFVADSRVTLLSMHLTKPPPPLREKRPEVSPGLERVILRALEKDRAARWQTAAEFAEELRGAAGGRGYTIKFEIPRGAWWVELARRTAASAQRVVRAASARLDRGGVGAVHRRALDKLRGWGVPRPSWAFNTAVVVVLMIMIFTVASVVRWRRAPPPEPPRPETVQNLQRAEKALASADLASARAVLQQELSAHPRVARVHYLLGNLHFAEGVKNQVPGDYRQAIKLDPAFAGDATLLANLRSLLDQKGLADEVVELCAGEMGAPAVPLLVDCARTCREASVRRAAADGAIKLGAEDQLPREMITSPELDKHLDTLENGRTCRDRKKAVAALRALGDKRAVEPLRRARDRRGGLLGWKEVNTCMTREINDAIRALGGQP